MKTSLLLFSISAVLLYGCTSNDLNKRVDKLTTRVDSLEKNAFWGLDIAPDDRTYKFDWFDLGKDEHQIVDRLFYISNIKTTFRDNGYDVSGTIGNISSMSISNAIIECAVKDTTIKAKVISGSSDVSTLFPGYKLNFSVFIPTTKTNVSEIGVLVRDYRM